MELMITVAIIGIISAIAIPSYAEYTQRARRAEATSALLEAAATLEKYFINNAGYPAASSPGTAALETMGIATSTERGYYQIRYSFDPNAALDGTNPRLQAVALNGAAQYQDTDCRTFQLGLDGSRSAFGADNSNNTAECWR